MTDRGQAAARGRGRRQPFGAIDVVVANAGIASSSQPVATIDPADFERTVEVDLLGQWRTARTTLPALIERRGHIMFIGSIYAFFNGVLAAPYAMSKAGVEQLAAGAARRTRAARRHGRLRLPGLHRHRPGRRRLRAGRRRRDPRRGARLPDTADPVGDAAKAVLDGISRRAARVTAPAWVAPMLAMRSFTTAVMDDVLLHNRDVARAVENAETEREASPT